MQEKEYFIKNLFNGQEDRVFRDAYFEGSYVEALKYRIEGGIAETINQEI